MEWHYCSVCGNYDIGIRDNRIEEFRKSRDAGLLICHRCNNTQQFSIYEGSALGFMLAEVRKDVETAYFEKLSYEKEMNNYLHG